MLIGTIKYSREDSGGLSSGPLSLPPRRSLRSFHPCPSPPRPAPRTPRSSLSPPAPLSESGLAALGVTAGEQHTCALRSDARVVCWGSNSNGQLGIGSDASSFGTAPEQTGDGLRPVDLGAGAAARRCRAAQPARCDDGAGCATGRVPRRATDCDVAVANDGPARSSLTCWHPALDSSVLPSFRSVFCFLPPSPHRLLHLPPSPTTSFF